MGLMVRARLARARLLLAQVVTSATVDGVLNLLKAKMFQQPGEPGEPEAAPEHCLKCNEPLHHHIYGLECRSCGSRWWHLGRLERDGWVKQTMALRDSAAPVNDPVKGRPCLECGTRMSVVHGPGPHDGGNAEWAHERVDVCLACDNLWLDPEELPGLEHGADPNAVATVADTEEEAKPAKRRLWRRQRRLEGDPIA
jgi:hypothetical protein